MVLKIIRKRKYIYRNVLSLFKIFFFNVYLFLRQRETEHEWGRVRERETQNPKRAPGY